MAVDVWQSELDFLVWGGHANIRRGYAPQCELDRSKFWKAGEMSKYYWAQNQTAACTLFLYVLISRIVLKILKIICPR
jgi:hypothetical protein